MSTVKAKIPPHNLEAEQVVLASLMIEDGCFDRISGKLEAADFYSRQNKTVFTTIEKLHEAGDVYDAMMVASALRDSSELERVGGVEHLAQLTRIIPNASNIERHASTIKDKAKLRQLQKTAGRIYELAESYDSDITLDPADAVGEAGQMVFELAKESSNKDPKHINRLIGPAFTTIEERCKSGASTAGTPCGFIDLDKMINGLQHGSLIIIAGRPGMGKTAFALNIAQNVCKMEKTAAVFSLEMTTAQLVMRIISAEAEVSQKSIQNGQLNQTEWEQLAQAAETLTGLNLYIDDTSNISVMEIRSKCRRMKASPEGLDLIIIDYLQLMENKRIEHREQQIADISRNLKALAKELEVPVIALSQLNRSVEARTDKTPMMSDLRESGAIEQDADQIIFIYRDDYYNADTAKKGIAEAIVSKNRNGGTGTAQLRFVAHLTKFRNLDRTGI